MRSGTIALWAMAVLVGVSPALEAADIRCPATITVTQSAVDPPDGWIAVEDPSAARWTSVAFSDGKPDEQVFPAPTETPKQETTLSNVWRFTETTDRGIWLSCRYSGTRVTLSRRLENVKQCRVTYDARSAPPVTTRVDCH